MIFVKTWNSHCLNNSVDVKLVKGKILICEANFDAKHFVTLGGVAGVLMIDTELIDNARSYPVPSAILDENDAIATYRYIYSNPYVS